MNEELMKPQAWKIICSPIPLVTFCSPISSINYVGIRLNMEVPIADKHVVNNPYCESDVRDPESQMKQHDLKFDAKLTRPISSAPFLKDL